MLRSPPRGLAALPCRVRSRLSPGGARPGPGRSCEAQSVGRKAWLNVNMPDSNLSNCVSIPPPSPTLAFHPGSRFSFPPNCRGTGPLPEQAPCCAARPRDRRRGWRPLPGGFGPRGPGQFRSQRAGQPAAPGVRAAGTGRAVQRAGPDLLPPTPRQGTGPRAGQRPGPGWRRRFLPAVAFLRGLVFCFQPKSCRAVSTYTRSRVERQPPTSCDTGRLRQASCRPRSEGAHRSASPHGRPLSSPSAPGSRASPKRDWHCGSGTHPAHSRGPCAQRRL